MTVIEAIFLLNIKNTNKLRNNDVTANDWVHSTSDDSEQVEIQEELKPAKKVVCQPLKNCLKFQEILRNVNIAQVLTNTHLDKKFLEIQNFFKIFSRILEKILTQMRLKHFDLLIL